MELLLDSVLRSADAYDYTDSFKHYGIASSTLKLLSSEDLKAIGVADEKVRDKLIKNISKLQIPAEKKIDLTVDEEYISQILYEISNQLTLHQANISHVVNRADTIVCDIKLEPAVNCLINCLNDLEKQIVLVQKQVSPKPKKRFKTFNIIMLISSALIATLCAVKAIKYSKI